MFDDDDILPFDPCDVVAGCRYLRALSKLEQLTGGLHSARFYEAVAARCRREGCWALLLHLRDPAPQRLSRFPLRASSSPRRSQVSTAKGATAKVIPLVRSDVADFAKDREGNFVERRAVKFGTLDRKEPLGYLYDYWRWLRAVSPCRLSNVDTVHLMRAGVIGKLHVIDVESTDPGEFRFDLAGYGIPLPPRETPRAFSPAIYADSLMRDYNTVRLTAAPRLQRVRARLGTLVCHYTRLILPLFETRHRVTRLLIAVRLEQDDGSRMLPNDCDSPTPDMPEGLS